MNCLTTFVSLSLFTLLSACGAPPGPPAPAEVGNVEPDEEPEVTARESIAEAPDPGPSGDPNQPMSMDTPMDVAAIPPYAEVTASGLGSWVLLPGSGTRRPSALDQVTVHYTGWTTDGAMFDSSIERGSPATFPLNGVIAGWTEGVALMVEGERRRLWIPQALAYGGRPGRPAGMLVFDVELISIQ